MWAFDDPHILINLVAVSKQKGRTRDQAGESESDSKRPVLDRSFSGGNKNELRAATCVPGSWAPVCHIQINTLARVNAQLVDI